MERLFVYGTLAPGEENEHWLRDIGGSWEPASVRGRLYPNGIGPTLGYPAVALDPLGDKIDGHLFTSASLADYWPALDEFEGAGYERVVASVAAADGSTVEAWVYALTSA